MTQTRVVSVEEWARVQKIERAYHEQKDPRTVLDVNQKYWQRILDSIPQGEVSIGPQTRILDVGCGGAGILLILENGIRTGVDPLMSFYRQKFSFLDDTQIRWVEGMAEDFDDSEKFDVIFSINMLDHTESPRASALNLERLLAPGGKLVCVLNVHLTRFWRKYYESFYRWVDPPHPHHIHDDDLPGYFPNLKMLSRNDIDSLWFDLRDLYDKQVCHRKRRDWKENFRNLLNPFKYPVAVSEFILGRPFHRRKEGDVPIMASTLFVFEAAQTND